MRARTFTTALSLSRRAYSLLLPLYPLVLRCRYGPEMVDVFEQQIRGACKQSGFTGLARVWLCVVSEIVQGALPSQLSWEMLGVSVVSVLSSLVLFGGVFLGKRDRKPLHQVKRFSTPINALWHDRRGVSER